MKTTYILKKSGSLLALTVLCAMASLVSSCKDDDDAPVGDLYFNIEGYADYVVPTKGISSSAYGNGKKFVVRSNGHWEFVPVDEEASSWAKVYPMEGDDDGYIRIYAEQNLSPVQRVASYRVILDGVEQPELLTVRQNNSEPFLEVSAAQLTLKRGGGEVSVAIDANVDWDFSVEGENAANFTCEAVSQSELKVVCANTNTSGADIKATLIVSGKGEFANLRHEISLVQLDATFFENFSWLKSEAGVLGWKVATGKKEIRIDQWTAEEKEHGWTSLSTWVYSRTGFVKFGKGGYGGDLASPCVKEITAPSNVTVSWNALGYGTASSVKDNEGIYYVAILGPGTITGCSEAGTLGFTMPYKDDSGRDVTLKAVRFEFGEMAWMIPAIDSTGLEIWQYHTSLFSIDVEGMDGSSRVVFVAGPSSLESLYKNPNSHNSRMFLDNFKVVVN